jgi:hypothetical protein
MPGGDTPDNHDRALALLCGMVGALSMARAVADTALSRALRDAVARAVAGPASRAGAREAAPHPRRRHRTR